MSPFVKVHLDNFMRMCEAFPLSDYEVIESLQHLTRQLQTDLDYGYGEEFNEQARHKMSHKEWREYLSYHAERSINIEDYTDASMVSWEG